MVRWLVCDVGGFDFSIAVFVFNFSFFSSNPLSFLCFTRYAVFVLSAAVFVVGRLHGE